MKPLFDLPAMTTPARLLDPIAALSIATDRAAGVPPESAVRMSIVAARIARAWGGDDAFVRECQLAALLRYLGCTSAAHEAAMLNDGDDMGFLGLFAHVDLGRPLEVIAVAPQVARTAPLGRRLRIYSRFANPRAPEEISHSHCEVACGLARRLGAGEGVAQALLQVYERWDGKGVPDRLRGEAISRTTRVVQASHVFEVLWRMGGPRMALRVVAARSGGQLDPELAELVQREGAALDDGLDAPVLLPLVLAEEPLPHARVTDDGLLDLATAFAHVADLKSTFTLDHSLVVADLADRCAQALGIKDRARLRAAALLHDIGRVGVPNGIWDKPEPLTRPERARAEEHTWFTEQILRSSTILEPVCEWAEVHERLDGSGYHRRVRAASLAPEARLLAACDVYAALIADRPHRPAHTKGAAAKLLGEETRAGRLDREAVRVILDEVGQPPPKLRGELPNGLSPREVEVLAMVARGRANKEIGADLHLAERTVKNHVARIYDKIGARTRAAAALFATQHGLLEAGRFEA